MVSIQTLFTNLTLLCHISYRVCSLTATHDWFPVMLVLCSWIHPFIIPVILLCPPTIRFEKNSLYIHYWICQFKDYVYRLMTGLFAWISLPALSWTYFIGFVESGIIFDTFAETCAFIISKTGKCYWYWMSLVSLNLALYLIHLLKHVLCIVTHSVGPLVHFDWLLYWPSINETMQTTYT